MLENMAPNARGREYLYQHDVGLSRLRRLMQKEAQKQLATLREQWEFHWNHQLRGRLEGLTDDEYFWSPVPDAWSVRPRGR